MPYGYGAVGISTFLGFFVGLYLEYTNPSNPSLIPLGYVMLFVGLVGMLLNKKALTGIPGGMLAGIGLGITLASESWFVSFVHSLGY